MLFKFRMPWKKSCVLLLMYDFKVAIHSLSMILGLVDWRFFRLVSNRPNTVMSSVVNLDIFDVVNSGKDWRYSAEIACLIIDSRWKLKVLCKNFRRSIDVNYWMLAYACCSIYSGLFRFATYIPMVGYLVALMTGLSLYTMHFLWSITVIQPLLHNLPIEIKAGPDYSEHI